MSKDSNENKITTSTPPNSNEKPSKKYDIFDSKHHEKFGFFRHYLSTFLISTLAMTSRYHLMVLNNSRVNKKKIHLILLFENKSLSEKISFMKLLMIIMKKKIKKDYSQYQIIIQL